MDCVHVTVSNVDTDGLQGEAILLARAVDKDGRSQAADTEGQVSVRRGISG